LVALKELVKTGIELGEGDNSHPLTRCFHPNLFKYLSKNWKEIKKLDITNL
jgi:hypothetical protein